jgi:hypothetical protein
MKRAKIKVIAKRVTKGQYNVYFDGYLMAELFSRTELSEQGLLDILERPSREQGVWEYARWFVWGAEHTGIESEPGPSKKALLDELKRLALTYDRRHLDGLIEDAVASEDYEVLLDLNFSDTAAGRGYGLY